MKKVGDHIMITGGAEHTPKVEVTRFFDPASMHHGDITLHIVQNGHGIYVSPETLRAILKWYEDK